MFGTHRERAVLGLVLMSCQAFFYNAVFFTYALVLTQVLRHPGARRSAGSCCPSRSATWPGRCCSGRFFDTIGRKPMITGTYGSPALLMAGDRPGFRRRLAVRLGTDGWPGR